MRSINIIVSFTTLFLLEGYSLTLRVKSAPQTTWKDPDNDGGVNNGGGGALPQNKTK